MPQVSPMSWLVIPSCFFIIFFTLFICIWWIGKSSFEFKNSSLEESSILKLNIWVW